MRPRTLIASFGLLTAVTLTPAASLTAVAQDATPPGVACTAPDLPPGSPTAPDATPVAAETAAEGAVTEATPAETPADAATADAAHAGLDNVLACIASGDFLKLAALLTPEMTAWITDTGNPYDVPASMEGAQPPRVVAEGEPVVDAEGRVGLQLVYGGFFNGPGQLTSERWYLVDEDGIWKVDAIVPATAPEGALPGATVVEVQMVDFAFALSQNTIPSGPVIFRISNTSYSHDGHVATVVTLTEGVSAEQVIQMEALPEDETVGFFGASYLESGQTTDLLFESLAPGEYTLVCDVSTPDGVEHWRLGMVAQVTVE